ncbi:ABC transporter ATP-binding protein [Gluconacetobacter azotocaptans]|uniref:ATP-binding cassette domain-containing protein n=1 Tax=Gluconacetobacter azotocaptans TaxID=142834 RepID=UPI001957A714|nr:ABC transporter ATP-binding protein [Gluconacetobacter azotocaptans]MBM9402784.1 ABC transporter ATP-binding protein [Gluconacetobacter azotocaptans]
MMQGILDIDALSVRFAGRNSHFDALRGVSLSLEQGRILGVVGESGSGKSVTGLSVMGLLPQQASITGGRIRFKDQDITARTPRHLRGASIAMVFQNPRAALNPTRRICDQLSDVIRAHESLDSGAIRQRVIHLLESVNFPDISRRMGVYPHELSGGLCQRVMIAMAIACSPSVIIADEPTTGLDVLTQKAVMDLLFRLSRERAMSMMLITHDLGLAAQYCDSIAVMQKGTVVESGSPARIFSNPQHAYTQRLVDACMTMHPAQPHPAGKTTSRKRRPLLEVSNLRKRYANGHLAVDDVSFAIAPGESLGLIGESGSGKSTLSRLVGRLLDPDDGAIRFEGRSIGTIGARDFFRAEQRPHIQLVFQDAAGSLNPRFTAFDSIADPVRRLGPARNPGALRHHVEKCAADVGLAPALLDRYPHQLSGGQCARVGIARAISVDPKLLILDEPTAALDVLAQSEILALLERLRREKGMSYLFVSHDLHIVRMICDRMVILQNGKIVETGNCEEVFQNPRAPYTAQLLAAIPHFRPASQEAAAATGTEFAGS